MLDRVVLIEPRRVARRIARNRPRRGCTPSVRACKPGSAVGRRRLKDSFGGKSQPLGDAPPWCSAQEQGSMGAPSVEFEVTQRFPFVIGQARVPDSGAMNEELSTMVPFAWILGCRCPASFRIGLAGESRWSSAGAGVLMACLGWILYSRAALFLPPHVLSLLAGTASGAAMLPYTVIREANPPGIGRTAPGVVNFPKLHHLRWVRS
jgi:hypothetical protein